MAGRRLLPVSVDNDKPCTARALVPIVDDNVDAREMYAMYSHTRDSAPRKREMAVWTLGVAETPARAIQKGIAPKP